MFLSIHCLKKKKDYSLLLKSIYLLTISELLLNQLSYLRQLKRQQLLYMFLPLLRAGHCCPGGLAVHSRPGGERGIWGSPVCHLALPPQLIPHQRDPATCRWPPDALRLADGKALTQSARHRRPQKAWMLEWHLSQGSGGLSTPARLTHLPGVEP